MSCPLCGCTSPPDVDDFTVDLDTNTICAGGKFVHVEGKPAEMAHIIREKFPRVATTDHLMARLYGGANDLPYDNVIKVFAHKLRNYLVGTGWQVLTEYRRGYRLARGEGVRGPTGVEKIVEALADGSSLTPPQACRVGGYASLPTLYTMLRSMEARGLVQRRYVGRVMHVEAAP